jgi:hypothetical protein
MRVSAFSDPANGEDDNEDWVSASPGLIVVLDGLTARTDTGCHHGIAWYATNLGSALSTFASNRDTPLASALRSAIQHVANQHSECDLTNSATPAAAVAILRTNNDVLEYLVLGDITIVLDGQDGLQVITDDRVDNTARVEREGADRYPIGSPGKQAALLRMKRAELDARNRPGGYWIAAADPNVVTEALTGKFVLDGLRRAAVLSDGGARIVRLFELLDWSSLLDLLDQAGPGQVVRRIRAAESADPDGRRWPRNKQSDDATIVYAILR